VQIVILALLVAALAFLILGLMASGPIWITASLATSVIAVLAIRSARRRAEAAPAKAAEAIEVAEPIVEPSPAVAESLATLDAGEVVLMESGDSVIGDEDEDPADEPAAAHTTAPLPQHSADTVWVVDGRPRYHLGSCSFLSGRQPEPIPLDQAVEDGFTPCSLCDPDTALGAN
jgi:hypothetical protein